MLSVLVRACAVASLVGILLGFYWIYDAGEKIRDYAVAQSQEHARQEACGDDPTCITDSASLSFIRKFGAALKAQDQLQRGRYTLYASLCIPALYIIFIVLRWVATGRVRAVKKRSDHD